MSQSAIAKNQQQKKQPLSHIVKRFRDRLTDIDALPQLTLLGIIIGCASGCLIIGFRLAIEYPLSHILPGNTENFEGLAPAWRFGLPVTGVLIIAGSFHFLDKKHIRFSVSYVLERLHNYQGRMPGINLVVQFIGGTIALVTGQSMGREGPAIHLGASIASLIGQWFRLPNNSMGTLVGCGVAAAIAASFNTPVAGVIFAMEVVLMSYTIAGFIPIMIASFCGALIARATFGDETFFSLNVVKHHGLWEIPFMVLAGISVALFATLYTRLQLGFGRLVHYPVFWRIVAAGLLTGSIGLLFPQILGLGYDTISLTIEGKLGAGLLLTITLAKIIATSFSVSMGLPGGLVGPQLFIGACVGGIMGVVGDSLLPGGVASNGTYVLLGMTAMMGAVLNAPLAALMAVVELTFNPGIIFPGMLVIVVSCVITRQLCRCDGIFFEQLKMAGTQLQVNPVQQLLSAIGVRSAMNTAFVKSPVRVSFAAATALLARNPQWLVIEEEDRYELMRAADLAIAMESIKEKQAAKGANTSIIDSIPVADSLQQETVMDLLEIPAQRYNLVPVFELSNLFEARQILDKKTDTALFVMPQIQTREGSKILGIITRDTIDTYYR